MNLPGEVTYLSRFFNTESLEFKKNYNKWLLTKENQNWSREMDNNDVKKYRLVAKTLNAASADDIAVDSNDDVELGLGGLSN